MSEGIQLSFLKLRDESVVSGGNVVMRNKGGASKGYGKGTFLFAIMISYKQISHREVYIVPYTFKSTGLPYLINEVLDILPLHQNTNTLGWITYEHIFI